MNPFEKELFALIHATITDVPVPPVVSLALVVLHDIQTLIFALHPSFFVNNPPIWMASFVPIMRFDVTDDSLMIALVVAILVIIVSVSGPPLVKLSISRQIKVPAYVQQVSRVLVLSLLTCLNIPILRLIAMSMKCMDNALGASHIGCSRSSSSMFVLFGVVTGCLFLPFSLIGLQLFFDTHPRRRDPLAKAHGRIDLKLWKWTAVLVILDVAHPAMGILGKPLFAIAGILGSAFFAFSFVEEQVYFDERVSAIRAGFMAASSACLFTSSILHAFAASAEQAFIASMAAAALSLTVVSAISHVRQKHFFSRMVKSWHNIKRDELQRKLELRNQQDGSSASPLAAESKRNKRNMSATPPTPQLVQEAAALGTQLPCSKDQLEKIVALLKEDRIGLLDIAHERAPKKHDRVFSSPYEVERCCRSIKANPTPTRVALGMQLLERAVVELKNHPLVTLQLLSFLTTFFRKDSAKVIADLDSKIRHANLENHDSLDIKYLAYLWFREQQKQQDKEETEILKAAAQKNHRLAHRTLVQLWEGIASGTPRQYLIQRLSALATFQSAARSSYSDLLAKNPRDLVALKCYGEYLQTVEADFEKSEQVLEFAEDVFGQCMERGQVGSRQTASGPLFNIPETDGDDEKSIACDNQPTSNASTDSLENLSTGSMGTNRSDELSALRRGVTTGYAASQASGTTAAQRAQLQLRGALANRIMSPLRPAWPVWLSATAFAASFVVGYWFCSSYFSQTVTVLERFTLGRNGRGAILEVIENLRQVVLTRDASQYNTYLRQLQDRTLPNAIALLPLLANEEARSPSRADALIQVYTPVFTQQSMDYLAQKVTPVELVTTVVNAANLVASVYAAPLSLTTHVFNSTLELRYLSENFSEIVFGIMQLGLTSVREYNSLNHTSLTVVSLCAVISLFAVAATAYIVYKRMLKRFLKYEDQILSMLQRMPEGIALSVHKQVAERCKPDSQDVLADTLPKTDADGASESKWMSTTAFGLEEHTISDQTRIDEDHSVDNEAPFGSPLIGRRAQYRLVLAMAGILLSAVVFGTFGTTLTSESVQADLHRYVYLGNRRFSSIAWRVFSQEHFHSDHTLPTSDIVRNCRIVLRNVARYHGLLENDPKGPSAVFPRQTIFPRDCTSSPTACPGVTELENVTIGFTRAVASQPLNAAVQRFIHLGDHVVDAMVNDLLRVSNMSSTAAAYDSWQLSLALSHDIVVRSTELNELVRSRMRSQLTHASTVCNIMLVVTLLVVLMLSVGYQTVIAGPLKAEAKTVVTLLYMIPPNLVREAKDVARFCETAGVELEVKMDR